MRRSHYNFSRREAAEWMIIMKVALLINRENMEKYSNPTHISREWELIHLGNGTPDREKLIATNADAIVVDSMLEIGADVIENMPNLKLIQAQGVGFNKIDLAAAAKAGVYVCNCAGSNARPVAEQALMLMMILLRSFRANEDAMYAGRQQEVKNACFAGSPKELGMCTVGIVGFGAVGNALANMLAAMGSKIYWYDTVWREHPHAEYMPMNKIFSTCDVVSLHVPVVPATINMINDESLARFKDGSILINTSRGELVDNDAVVRALRSGKLAGFGADTVSPEPVLADNPLLAQLTPDLRAKVALSPHIAGLTAGSFNRTYITVWSNVSLVARGERPGNVVNKL